MGELIPMFQEREMDTRVCTALNRLEMEEPILTTVKLS